MVDFVIAGNEQNCSLLSLCHTHQTNLLKGGVGGRGGIIVISGWKYPPWLKPSVLTHKTVVLDQQTNHCYICHVCMPLVLRVCIPTANYNIMICNWASRVAMGIINLEGLQGH